jgi:N utilization substance protein B
LYEADASGHPAVSALRRLTEQSRMTRTLSEFANGLVTHVERNRRALDARIEAVAAEFPSGQLAAVDRNIIRVALAELETHPDTPRAVVANEAVELAHIFGAESSGRFVNGVLGALLR